MVSLVELFAAAARDRRHGAGEIERRLVEGLIGCREAWSRDALAAGAVELVRGQPAMANLRSLARALAGGALAEVEGSLLRRAALLDELPERLGAAARPHLEGAARVVTLSRSSAVAAVLSHAWEGGWRGETVVLDGSPAGGGPDQAVVLARVLDDVRSQPDATAPQWLDGGRVRVLIGADALSTERLVNACGTLALLELAGSRSVPVLVVADTGKDLPDAELDELIAASPSQRGDEPGRLWRIFEAAPLAAVTVRIHE